MIAKWRSQDFYLGSYMFSFLGHIEKLYYFKVETNYQEISHLNYFTLSGYKLSNFIIPLTITTDIKLLYLRYSHTSYNLTIIHNPCNTIIVDK